MATVRELLIGNRKLCLAGMFAVLMILPFAANEYIVRLATVCGIYAILTLSLNLVTGYAGQFCLGWAAFYGIGAYASALLTLRLDFSFWLALPMAGLIAAFFGAVLGLPTMRLKDIYFAITSLAFGEIIRLVLLNWTGLTRGAMGLPGIPGPSIFGVSLDHPLFFYYFALLLAAISIFSIVRFIHSRLGRALTAIREDELAAESMGIDTTRCKVIAFVIGAFFAGIAGSFYAHYSSFIDPHTFAFPESISILAMMVLGGMGSVAGSIVGAVILTLLPELLRGIAEYRMIIFGLIMMLVMLIRPQGLLGKSYYRRGQHKVQSQGEEGLPDAAVIGNQGFDQTVRRSAGR